MTTYLRVLHEDLEFSKYYFRRVSHSMTENEAQCPVTFSEKFLQVLRHARETDFEHVLTDNESWFYYEYSHDSAWVLTEATLPTRKAQTIQTKKCLVFIIWSTFDIHNLLALPAGM
jgi:hypothetical protein